MCSIGTRQGFPLSQQVIGPYIKLVQGPRDIQMTRDKYVTAILAASAHGDYLPVHLIYKGKTPVVIHMLNF